MLQSVTESYRVLQSVTECYRVILAHLLGPISGLVSCTWYFPVKDTSRLTLLDPCPAEEALVG